MISPLDYHTDMQITYVVCYLSNDVSMGKARSATYRETESATQTAMADVTRCQSTHTRRPLAQNMYNMMTRGHLSPPDPPCCTIVSKTFRFAAHAAVARPGVVPATPATTDVELTTTSLLMRAGAPHDTELSQVTHRYGS